MGSGQREGPCLIVSANWRLENTKSPAAMLQQTTQTPHAWVYRVVCILLHLRCKHMSVSKLVTAELLSVGWRIGTDTGCAGLVLARCRWVEKTVLNTQQAPTWNMWFKWQRRDGFFRSRRSVTQISTPKMSQSRRRPSQGWVSAVLRKSHNCCWLFTY